MSMTVSEIQAKWKRNTQTSGPSYVAGIRGVTESPMEKAAQAQDKYLANVTQAVQDGRYAEGLRSVSLQSWKDAAETVGAPRLQTGVAKGEAKMAAFLAEFIPQQQAITRQVRAMPSTTEADREERMLAQVRATRALKFRRKR